jgi:transcriptional regulator with XRE-family HTH domain
MSDSLKLAVAERIRQARKEAKLTQEQVASELGLTKQSVSHWETARWLPAQADLGPLARLLGKTTDYLLMGIGPRIPILVPYASMEQLLEIARGNLDPKEVEGRWPSSIQDSDALIAFSAIDRGMESRIPADSVLTMRYRKLPEPGEIALVALLAHNELLLRRYRPGPSGKPGELPFTLKPDNPDYGEARTIAKKDRPVTIGTLAAVCIQTSR